MGFYLLFCLGAGQVMLLKIHCSGFFLLARVLMVANINCINVFNNFNTLFYFVSHLKEGSDQMAYKYF